MKSAGEGKTKTTKESASDCATVLAHAATDDAAVGSEMTCRNNAVSAAQETSESAARLTDDSASSEEDLGEALRAAWNEPAHLNHAHDVWHCFSCQERSSCSQLQRLTMSHMKLTKVQLPTVPQIEPHLKQMMLHPHWAKLSVTLLWTEMLRLKAVKKMFGQDV